MPEGVCARENFGLWCIVKSFRFDCINVNGSFSSEISYNILCLAYFFLCWYLAWKRAGHPFPFLRMSAVLKVQRCSQHLAPWPMHHLDWSCFVILVRHPKLSIESQRFLVITHVFCNAYLPFLYFAKWFSKQIYCI